ncbi:hypothetical protein NA57DRAFT_50711 [Rhizodiscina lignyota]|uniref:Cytochrome b561 domain-containing protein n=1 Tax=Rhizodiscina lignyota TaxID=1504668 RepID=A0A9P4IT89_9PEZI|nr:hypothetical protein NA57DRAFT_50711 [Rhizodiscina lignyota]
MSSLHILTTSASLLAFALLTEANRKDGYRNGAESQTTSAVQPGQAREVLPAEMNKRQSVVWAHGLMMAIAFIVLLPCGAMLVYLPKFKGRVWLHAGWQLFTYAILLAGMGLGVWLTEVKDYWEVQNGHPSIGVFVVGALLLQPLTGLIHYWQWERNHPALRSASISGEVHRWWGRIIVILGIVNGGLGMHLAGIKTGRVITYSVLAGFFSLSWLGVVVGTHFYCARRAGVARPEQSSTTGTQRVRSEGEQHFRTASTTKRNDSSDTD